MLCPEPVALAAARRPANAAARRTLRARLLTIALLAFFVGLPVVYYLAVRTRGGQAFENAALAGAGRHQTGTWYEDADRWLNRLTAESFGFSLAVIAAVGLLRRRWMLALCGVATAGGAALASRLLKHWLPARPSFAGLGHPATGTGTTIAKAAGSTATATAKVATTAKAAAAAAARPDAVHNSFPSGHAAAAMGLFFAVLIVVSRRWYLPATVLGLPGAVGAGVATVAADWHRLSDTVGADLVALAAGTTGLALVAQLGLVGPALRPASAPQRWLCGATAALATVAFAAGGAYLLRYHGAAAGPAANQDAYWASQALALGFALAAATVMLAVCLAVEAPPRRPKILR